MKAAVCTRYGPPEVVRIMDVPKPAPGPDEVCIRIRATTVTASDCLIRGLKFSRRGRIVVRLALGLTAPRRRILGLVLAGQVDSVGPDVKQFRPGDEVFGFDEKRLFGAHAEYVCWPESDLFATRPSKLTYEEAAAIPYGGALAMHFLVRKGEVERRERVLIYGASGAVGTSAIQLARHFGAEVTAVCSTANAELVRSLGASAVIDYTHDDFTALGETYDLIFDAVGRRKSAQALANSARALAPNGAVVSVDDGVARVQRSDMLRLQKLADEGELRPVIDRTYPLSQIVEAHRYVDGGHKKGNVVVTV